MNQRSGPPGSGGLPPEPRSGPPTPTAPPGSVPGASASGAALTALEALLREANEQLVLRTLAVQHELDTSRAALLRAIDEARSDGLTGLPNRLSLLDRIGVAITHATRAGEQFALLFIDLDGFKHINDTLGHATGDEVLRRVAQALVGALRAVDTVSRHGGDEFIVLLPDTATAAGIEQVAAKLRLAVSVPAIVGDHLVSLTASIGVATYPADGTTVDALLRHADAAMYRAKRARRRTAPRDGTARAPAAFALPPPASWPPLGGPAAAAITASQALLALNAQLRDANQALVLSALTAQELVAAAELAQQRNAAFLATTAHEMRAPLSPIAHAAALLGRPGAHDALPYLQGVIDRQVQHLTRLVEDLLEHAHTKASKLRLQLARVDLADTLAAAVEVCRGAIDERRQRLELELPDEVLRVEGDAVRLAQIVINLLGNASKYTPQGGTLWLTLRRSGEEALVAVADTGIGIGAAVLPFVFEPFVREPHAVRYDATGLGIGLSVVGQLVAAHGGSIVATSEGPGCGSRFEMRLPLAPAPH